MKRDELKQTIWQWFQDGHGSGIQSATTAKDFSRMFLNGNTPNNRRKVGKAIEDLRAELKPICSNDNSNAGYMGYYIPETREEADTFYRSAKARARKTFISVANVAKALNNKFGVDEYQIEMKF